ncbi:N-acetylmuramoyl-L-alanine amidase family protein [Paenibacillus monticola]|uniref:AMIN domain-containing protein n=1 Tax=Paenibacillus monticola TaxID=2666075 RepID=A0A7X2H4F1_9BACL|nr:N-acetylmuramoyl-L-alanine amidase family protein [Paenibacillus monticola]MRN53315.1 AMIN domain-containing protein [Paenibacillus monticola]
MRRAGRVLLLLLLPLLLLSFTGYEASAAASSTGRIILDNRELTMPKGIALENVNGSVMIPVRVVVENLGFQVLWEQKTRKVTVQQDGKSIELAVGRKTANADGVTLDLNAAPKQSGSTVLVPIRFVSEQFGLKVGWDNMDKTVYLTGGLSSGTDTAAIPTATPTATYSPAPTPTATPLTGTVEGNVTGSATPTPLPLISPTPEGSGGIVVGPQVKGAVFSENRLIVAVTGAVKPTVTTMSSPDRIIVDFPGAAFAPEFAGSLPVIVANGSPQGKLDVTGYPLVSELRYALFSVSPPTVRFVIQTVGSQPYQLSTDESTGLVTIDLNVLSNVGGSPAVPVGSGKPIVVLDAGHGGSQPGAISVTGKKEKDFNLAVIRKVGALLMQNSLVEVIYTRTDDITLGLQDRVNIAKAVKANLFISVHANAMDSSSTNWNYVNGSETYYSRSESLPLAQIMHKHLVAGTGFKDNGVRNKSLHVTRETSMPAILLEAGYLTNLGDEAALYTEKLQDNLAREIAAGIMEYLGL